MKYQYKIVGCDKIQDERYIHATIFNVVAESPKKAIEKAKKILKKNVYEISQINEQDQDCVKTHQQQIKMQQDFQLKVLKALKDLK